MISQISSPQVLHGHIEVLPILEGRNHVDDERIAELLQNGLLVDDRTNTLFQNNFGYLFHGVNLVALLLLNFPDPPKATRAHLVQKLEVVTTFLSDFDCFVFEGSRNVRVVIAYESSVVPVLLHSFLDRLGLWGSGPEFQCFDCFIAFGANEDPGWFRNIHVQCEL